MVGFAARDPVLGSVGRRHGRRCLPLGLQGSGYFSDAACSHEIVPLPDPAWSCVDFDSSYARRADPAGKCSGAVKVFALGAGAVPVARYTLNGGVCEQQPVDPTVLYAALGAEILPSAFVGFTVTHD